MHMFLYAGFYCTQRLLRERKFVVLIKGKNPGVWEEDFTEDIATQGVGHEFDMELRESTIPTRCSVLNLRGVHSTNFIPNLKARCKMSSFHFCERCLHSTADVDTKQT